jgi:hypothetical protein
MEVDRVSQMGGVRPEGVAAWPQRENRRRKFVEEVPESESEAEEHAAATETPERDADRGGALDVMA